MRGTLSTLMVAVLSIGTASAQSQMDCYTSGGHTMCRSPPPDLSVNAGNAIGTWIARRQTAKRAAAEERAQSDAYDEQRSVERLYQARREMVGELVANGKCEEARTSALRSGDFALADEVRNACKEKAVPKDGQ